MINNKDTAKTVCSFNNGELIQLSDYLDKYDIANHVPEKSIKEFITAIRNKFNIIPFLDQNNGRVRLLNLDEILKSPVIENLTEISDELRLISIKNYTGYAFIDKGEHDETYSAQIKDFAEFKNQVTEPPFTEVGDDQEGLFRLNEIRKNEYTGLFIPYFQQLTMLSNPDNANKIKWDFYSWIYEGNLYSGSSVSELRFESEITHPIKTILLPEKLRFQGDGVIDEEFFQLPRWIKSGNSELIPNPEKDSGLNLLFYKGIAQNLNDIDYPFATHNDDPILAFGSMSLSYHRQNGLVAQYWQHTINMFMNRGRIYETIINMPLAQLLNFDFAKKYKIHQGTYLVKNIKGNFTMDGIEYTSAEVVEC